MVRGRREDAVSELEAGRRTIVRDPDDPPQESDILDSLMVSAEKRAAMADLDEVRYAVRNTSNKRTSWSDLFTASKQSLQVALQRAYVPFNTLESAMVRFDWDMHACSPG